MCSFQHNRRAEAFECEDCDFVGKTETEIGKHIDEKHEGWRVTQNFCDYFCRVEHDNIFVGQVKIFKILLDLTFGKPAQLWEVIQFINALDVTKLMMMMIK